MGGLPEENKDRISIDSIGLYFALSLVCRRIQELIDSDALIQPEELHHLREYCQMILQEHDHALYP